MGSGLPSHGLANMINIGDDGMLTATLQIVYHGLHFWGHAAFAKMPFGEVMFGLGERKLIEPNLVGLAKIERHLGHAGGNHQPFSIKMARQQSTGKIFVDDGKCAAHIAICPTQDRHAPAANGDDNRP